MIDLPPTPPSLKIINKLAALAALTGLLVFAPKATATVVTWNEAGSTMTIGGFYAGNSNDFDDVTMTFAGIYVGDYQGITSTFGYLHDHGGSVTFALDFHVDGSWVNAWNFDSNDSGDINLDAFGGAVLGSSVFLDGIRLSATPAIGYAFHNVDLAFYYGDDPDFVTNFNFADASAASVPDSGSTIASLGLALGALALFRRKLVRAV